MNLRGLARSSLILLITLWETTQYRQVKLANGRKKMITPELKIHEGFSGWRVYETRGRRYLSVTTILNNAYLKPFLMGWESRMAAETAVSGRHAGMSEREATTYLQRSSCHYMWIRLEEGNSVHRQLESILAPAAQGIRPIWWMNGSTEGYIRAARAFCEDNLSVVLATECRVFSDRFSYAGTVDLMARTKSGKVIMVDWKTSKSIYPDNALRLAAYAGTDWMIEGNGNVREMVFPSEAAVVSLDRTGRYEARFLSREKMIEHHPIFRNLLDIQVFLDSADNTWSEVREGGAAE